MADNVTTITQPEVSGAPEIDPGTGKFVFNYQPRDAEGQFIGKPYRFLYKDNPDLVQQITEAKEQADRTIHEIKIGKRKIVGEAAVKNPDWIPAPESTEDEEKKRREDFRRTAEAEFGAPIEEVRNTLKMQRETAERLTAQNWAMNKEAEGYYPCAENAKKITTFLNEKKWAFTPANYDLAFEELKDSLKTPPKEEEVTADSTQQPAATTVEPTQEQPKPRSTGVMPGQFQGTRPGNQPQRMPLTVDRFRQIAKLSRDGWNKLRRDNPKEAEAYLKMKFPAQPPQ